MFWELVQLYRPQVPSDSELISSLIEAKAQAFSLLLAQVQLVDQVLPFLEIVRQLYPRLGLTTSATLRDQQQIFDQFQLHSWFDVVVTADDITRAKPDPEPYLRTTARLQLPPAQCLVIEDSIAGIQAAKAAGCTVVGITTGLGAPELWAGGADQVVASFAELAQWLHLPLRKTSPEIVTAPPEPQ
jgi:HAD superfamily hydrolase (TIGR01509 family)